MNTPPRVLWIDDELDPGLEAPDEVYLWYYVRALRRKGYEVTEVRTTDDALAALAPGAGRFDLIVLDVLMPPGKCLAGEDTEQGRRTGVLFLDRLRKLEPDAPVVVFTQFGDEVQALLRNRRNCRVVPKAKMTQRQFADELARVLAPAPAAAP